jgi:clan AA aspartic protease (TIGR02281 family)
VPARRWPAVRAVGPLLTAAVLAGCQMEAQQQYQYRPVVSSLASQECRALEAVIQDRQRYGIVARSGAQDDVALRQCMATGEVPLKPPQFSPRAQGPEEVPIEKRGSSYYVPVRINDTITLPFLLDTGAGDLAIPADVARTLIRAGALKSSDLIGERSYQIANGSEEVSSVVSIRDVRVGEHVVRNVTAAITSANGEPLLGQSFLSKFGAVTVDYQRLVLVLSP